MAKRQLTPYQHKGIQATLTRGRLVADCEAELATQLAVLQHQQQILTVRDEPVPAQYHEMVDKYFEMLSKKKNEFDQIYAYEKSTWPSFSDE